MHRRGVLQTDPFPTCAAGGPNTKRMPSRLLIVARTAEHQITVIDFLQSNGDVVIGPYRLRCSRFRLARLLRGFVEPGAGWQACRTKIS